MPFHWGFGKKKKDKGQHSPDGSNTMMPDGAIPSIPAGDGETPPSRTFNFRSGAASEQGAHSKNDDCARSGWWCNCFAVSDGIGGAPDGDYMSRVSCGAALESYGEERDIVSAFKAANAAALQVSKWIDNPLCGATLLLAALDGDQMTFAWCGDSVAYRLRDGQLQQMTYPDREDDSNRLRSAVGYEESLEPLLAVSDVREGDRFLLCTDGVWTVFEETGRMDALADLMANGDNAPIMASMICMAAREDGYDDASAVFIMIDGMEPGTAFALPDAPAKPSVKTPAPKPPEVAGEPVEDDGEFPEEPQNEEPEQPDEPVIPETEEPEEPPAEEPEGPGEPFAPQEEEPDELPAPEPEPPAEEPGAGDSDEPWTEENEPFAEVADIWDIPAEAGPPETEDIEQSVEDSPEEEHHEG